MLLRRLITPRVEAVLIVALCGLGLAMRVSGLTSRDPWFDDAWAALPAHVPLGDALRMVVTTPLYALGLREWIILGPTDTWWAQLPALVLGVLGIAAIYLLVRAHRFSPLAGFVAAAVIAAGPITVNYSTRLKEYSADLLLVVPRPVAHQPMAPPPVVGKGLGCWRPSRWWRCGSRRRPRRSSAAPPRWP